MTHKEEGRVADSSGSRDDLTTTTVNGFLSQTGIEHSEFDSTDRCNDQRDAHIFWRLWGTHARRRGVLHGYPTGNPA